MKKLNVDALVRKIGERKDRAEAFHKRNKPDCGMHNHRFDCFLDDPPEEWERVQRMREEGHPLVKGGKYREFEATKDYRAVEVLRG